MRSRRAVLASWAAIALSVVMVGLGTALLLSVQSRLPERIATHWSGSSNVPDGVMSLNAVLWAGGALVIGTAVVLAVPGLVVRQFGAVGELSAFAAGTSVFVAVLIYGLSWAQSRSSEPPAPFSWIIPAGVLGVAVGALWWWWARTRPGEHDRRGAVVDGPVLDVAPATRIAWLGRPRTPTLALVAIATAALAPLPMVLIDGLWPAAVISVVVPAVVAVVLLAGRVRIDGEGLAVRYLFGVYTLRVPLERVAGAESVSVSALRDFGGWGYRIGRSGARGVITGSGEALRVQRHGDPDLVVTIDDADRAAATLNTLTRR